MTSKLKCPFCGEKLVLHWGMESPAIYCCDNQKCNRGGVGTEQSWQALTQAKQDLEIAIKGIKTLGEYDPYKEHLGIDTIAQNILEQIEHKK